VVRALEAGLINREAALETYRLREEEFREWERTVANEPRRPQRLFHGAGEERIDLAKLYGYDLILLDLSLPDVTGREVHRPLRLARIETLILTRSGGDATESKLKASPPTTT
jgi:DNA-binding response OmpR family regulator